MVIAGGRASRTRPGAPVTRFNGAGDGDRRRGGRRDLRREAILGFNGAGDGDRRREPEVFGGAISQRALQRSRRW